METRRRSASTSNSSDVTVGRPEPQDYRIPHTDIMLRFQSFQQEVPFITADEFLDDALVLAYRDYHEQGPSIRINHDFVYEGDGLLLWIAEARYIPRDNPGLTYSVLCDVIRGIRTHGQYVLEGDYYETSIEILVYRAQRWLKVGTASLTEVSPHLNSPRFLNVSDTYIGRSKRV